MVRCYPQPTSSHVLRLDHFRVDDMADEFPHVRFYGIDSGRRSTSYSLHGLNEILVPLMNRYPAANVQFEMGDVTSTLRWESQSFDLVHARFVTLGVSVISFSLLATDDLILLCSHRYPTTLVSSKKSAA